VCEQGGRPVVSLWRAEDILNWTAERVGQAVTLVEVVLRDAGRLRVLKLVDSTCVQEFWKKGAPPSTEGSDTASDAWVRDESVTIKRGDAPLPFIPFVFHGPRDSRPGPDRLPLADIIAANLDHYRLDADFKHGLHFAALPTAWVSGFDKAAALRIGSSAAWVLTFRALRLGSLSSAGQAWGTSTGRWSVLSAAWLCWARGCWK